MRAAAFQIIIAALALGATSALAQTYPTHPVSIVVGYPPGATSDLLARTVGDPLSTVLGQPVVIDNRPGAGGNVGAAYVARAPGDGYTLMGHPGKLSFGSSGTASPHHLAGELLRLKAGIDIQHVPYKGGGAAVNDLLGGHIGLAFLSLSSAMPQVSTGKIRIIAVVEKNRYAGLPDVPTIAETVPGVEMSSWLGFFAPAATPQPIVARLHDDIVRILKTDAVRDKLGNLGFSVTGTSSAELADDVRAGLALRGQLMKSAGIEPE